MSKKLIKKVLVEHKKPIAAKVLAGKEIKKPTVAEAMAGKEIVTGEKVKTKEDKKYNLTVGIKDLFDVGCHLGHKVSKTHPKAKKNIFVIKDGIEVIDLAKTIDGLEKACNYVYNAKRNGKQIVMIGTKRPAREAVRRVAVGAGIPYVTDRWLGGTITNWDQIKKNIKKLKDYKEGMEKGKFAENTKKEQLMIKKETARLEKIVGGLSTTERLFDVVFVVDAGFEKTAIKEAKMRGIKTIAIADSDSNPDKVDIAIPANDDNVKSISIIVEEIGKAIKSA